MVDGNMLWDMRKSITTEKDLPENLYAALKKTTDRYPEKTALIDHYGRKYSYSDFLRRSDELAAFLYWKKGVLKSKRIGLLMYNSFEFCVAFLAAIRLGAAVVPLPGKFKQAELESLIVRSNTDFVICDEDYKAWVDEVDGQKGVAVVRNTENEYGFTSVYQNWESRCDDMKKMQSVPMGQWNDQAVIMYTSGTTAQSKGGVLCNSNLMYAVEAYKTCLCITEKDISVIATPIYHITGLVALLGLFLYVGGTLYLHKTFDAERVVNEARENKLTFIHASPTVFHMIILEAEGQETIPSLKSFACGSSNMAKDKISALHKWLPHSVFHTVYGLTETSSPAAIFPDDAATSPYIGSSGKPIPGTMFKIVDESRREVQTGEVGEVAVKGTVVLKEYDGLDTELLKDGWLYTGDMGYFNEENYLYIVDRKKDMINRGGEKIWCFDVENELMFMDGICDAAVVGIPDDVYGEVAAAVVQLRSGCEYTQEEIQEKLRKRMAKYKVPVKIQFVDHVPQTPNGKIDKKKIRQFLTDSVGGSSS